MYILNFYTSGALGLLKKVLIILAFIYLFMVSELHAKEKITMVTEIFPPLQMLQEDKLTGIGVDIVNELVQMTGFESEIRAYPWARAYQYAFVNENTLIFTMARTKQREKLFKWVGSLDFEDKSYIWTVKSKEWPKDIDWKELHDMSTAIPRDGSQLNTLLTNGFSENHNLFITNNDENAIKMLFKDRIDFIIAGEHTLNYQLSLLNLDIVNLQKHNITKMEKQNNSELSIAFNINTSDDIVNRFKSALEQLKNNGRIEEIIAKWQ
jgi:polar amino acid transport system substrate-binding protein